MPETCPLCGEETLEVVKDTPKMTIKQCPCGYKIVIRKVTDD